MGRSPSVERRRFWSDLIRRQQQSGMSIAALCREHGVSSVSFYQWRTRLASEGSQTVPAEVSFVPLPLAHIMPSRSAKFTVRLPNSVQVKVPFDFDELALRRLLTVTAAVVETTERRDA